MSTFIHNPDAYMGIPEALTARSVGCSMIESIRPYSNASCADMKKSRSVSSMIYMSKLSQNLTEDATAHHLERLFCELSKVAIQR